MRYDYDMLGNRIHQASMEAGERWMLNDVAGKPIRAWDSRGHRFRTDLRRAAPADGFLLCTEARRRACWSDAPSTARLAQAPKRTTCAASVCQIFDQAGVVTSDELRLQGQPAAQPARNWLPDYKTTLDWSAQCRCEAETFTSRTHLRRAQSPD